MSYSRISLLTTRTVICILVLLGSANAQEQSEDNSKPAAEPVVSPPSPRPKQNLARSFATEEWRMWTSPFRRSNYETKAIKKYVIPFALISTALIASDSKTKDLLPNTLDQTVWSGRVSQIGGAASLAGGSAATYLIGKVAHNEHAAETGAIALRAIAHTQLLTFGMKQITNRQRPISDKALSGFWNGGDSFPSGHAATSFAVATVFAYEYRDQIIVPITAYSLATLVAASRVSARRHWVSDIFVGSSMGFLVGRHMYKLHHDPSLPGSIVGPKRTSRLVPQIGFSPTGPVLSWGL